MSNLFKRPGVFLEDTFLPPRNIIKGMFSLEKLIFQR